MNFDFENGCHNQFKDNNGKSCSWLPNGHADSVGVNLNLQLEIFYLSLDLAKSSFNESYDRSDKVLNNN